MCPAALNPPRRLTTLIRGVTVLPPPQSVWDYSDEDLHRMLQQRLEDMYGNPDYSWP
jgi:hypothetical protein